MNDSRDEVVITAMGLAGCLALDGANACAAARAGLSRARELPFLVIDEETGEPVGVTGFPIAGLSDGFEGAGRVARVLQLALTDLKRNLPTPDPSGDRCGWIMALPGWLSAGEENAPPPSGLRQQAPSLPAAVRALLQVSLRSAGFELEAGRIEVHSGDHAAFGSALQEGMRRLRAREVECCVVGAADTLLDTDVLQALMEAGRLKTPNEPLGLSPGEGGAFYLIERGDAARRRGATILAVITGVANGVDEDRLAERAPSGRALAGLAASITDTTDAARPPLLVTDYNGEEHRSAEYGHTLFQLGALNPAFQETRTWFPAASFGDTGAASAAIGLGMVLRGFARGYAGASEALVLSSSPAEARSVLGVRAAT